MPNDIHRISATLTESQYQYLAFMAETEGLPTTTYACRLIEDKIRNAIYENRVPLTLPRTERNLSLMTEFIHGLVESKKITDVPVDKLLPCEDEELETIAKLVGCNVRDLTSLLE